MTLVDERMEQAASDLHQVVEAVPIPNAPRSRSRGRRDRRHAPAWTLAAAFTAALLVGVPALLPNSGVDDSQSTQADSSGEPAPSQSDSAEPVTTEGFPRLIVDVSQLGGLDLVSVLEEDNSPGDTGTHLVAYTDTGEGLEASRIWILTRASGTDFFRGEAYLEDGWTEVTVNEGRAYTRVGNLAPAVIWDTGSGDDGPAVFAYALNLELSVLVEVVNGLTESAHGWEATDLPEGLTPTYSGPERVEGSRLSLVWADQQATGEIILEFIKEGSNPMERTLYTLLGPGNYPASTIGTDEIRGNSAVRVGTWIGQTEDAQTVFQWMETPAVMARLIVQGLTIDADRVVDALRAVDQSTWETTLESAITSNDPNATPTTIAPTTTTIETTTTTDGANSP